MAPVGWRAQVDEELPVLGHRNWIVVADWAYPKQSAPGIKTIWTGGNQLEVVRHVLDAVDAAPHVNPIIMLDAELSSVVEADAPGIAAYREALQKLLDGRPVSVMPHEEIIARLDEGSRLFNVLILKTDMVLPYTSVFFQLDCGYWGPEEEQRLREAINK